MSEKTNSAQHEEVGATNQRDSGRTLRHQTHDEHKIARNDRLSRCVYGEVRKPVIPNKIAGIWEPPSYVASRKASSYSSTMLNDKINRRLDMRCFYTGVVCDPAPACPPARWNHNPRYFPWLGTRDHLVPARRNVPACPIAIKDYQTSLVWSSNIANVTLGLSPLPVRLTVRRWLLTVSVDRDDRSIDAGMNMRWLIISMLDEFRIRGRYPWSRDSRGRWWYPEISQPFMERMWKMEQEFLLINDANERDRWIRQMSWKF